PVRLAPPVPPPPLTSNENRDPPCPPEMNTPPNPPTGAVFDYVLAKPPRGPVVLEVRDIQDTLVRRFASDAPPARPAARQYFADRWLLPPEVPGAKAGHNRFVWDLHPERPRSPEYEFTSRAVPERDTPTTPRGPLVRPGMYKARLTVDGATVEQSFEVVPDPRVRIDAAGFHTQMQIVARVQADLARVTDALEAAEKAKPAAGSPRAKV